MRMYTHMLGAKWVVLCTRMFLPVRMVCLNLKLDDQDLCIRMYECMHACVCVCVHISMCERDRHRDAEKDKEEYM